MSDQIKEAINFLTDEKSAISFGSKTVTLIYHDGKLKRVERVVCEKSQSE